MKFTVIAPAKSGYREEFGTFEAAAAAAAELLGIDGDDMVTEDGTTTDGEDCCYCYASEEAAQNDADGAYAVKVIGGHAAAYLG